MLRGNLNWLEFVSNDLEGLVNLNYSHLLENLMTKKTVSNLNSSVVDTEVKPFRASGIHVTAVPQRIPLRFSNGIYSRDGQYYLIPSSGLILVYELPKSNKLEENLGQETSKKSAQSGMTLHSILQVSRIESILQMCPSKANSMHVFVLYSNDELVCWDLYNAQKIRTMLIPRGHSGIHFMESLNENSILFIRSSSSNPKKQILGIISMPKMSKYSDSVKTCSSTKCLSLSSEATSFKLFGNGLYYLQGRKLWVCPKYTVKGNTEDEICIQFGKPICIYEHERELTAVALLEETNPSEDYSSTSLFTPETFPIRILTTSRFAVGDVKGQIWVCLPVKEVARDKIPRENSALTEDTPVYHHRLQLHWHSSAVLGLANIGSGTLLSIGAENTLVQWHLGYTQQGDGGQIVSTVVNLRNTRFLPRLSPSGAAINDINVFAAKTSSGTTFASLLSADGTLSIVDITRWYLIDQLNSARAKNPNLRTQSGASLPLLYDPIEESLILAASAPGQLLILPVGITRKEGITSDMRLISVIPQNIIAGTKAEGVLLSRKEVLYAAINGEWVAVYYSTIYHTIHDANIDLTSSQKEEKSDDLDSVGIIAFFRRSSDSVYGIEAGWTLAGRHKVSKSVSFLRAPFPTSPIVKSSRSNITSIGGSTLTVKDGLFLVGFNDGSIQLFSTKKLSNSKSTTKNNIIITSSASTFVYKPFARAFDALFFEDDDLDLVAVNYNCAPTAGSVLVLWRRRNASLELDFLQAISSTQFFNNPFCSSDIYRSLLYSNSSFPLILAILDNRVLLSINLLTGVKQEYDLPNPNADLKSNDGLTWVLVGQQLLSCADLSINNIFLLAYGSVLYLMASSTGASNTYSLRVIRRIHLSSISSLHSVDAPLAEDVMIIADAVFLRAASTFPSHQPDTLSIILSVRDVVSKESSYISLCINLDPSSEKLDKLEGFGMDLLWKIFGSNDSSTALSTNDSSLARPTAHRHAWKLPASSRDAILQELVAAKSAALSTQPDDHEKSSLEASAFSKIQKSTPFQDAFEDIPSHGLPIPSILFSMMFQSLTV